MKRHPAPVLRLVLVAGLLIAGPFDRAQEKTMNAAPAANAAVTHFVKPEALDVAKILPAPPAAGSVAAQADLEAVVQAQAWRTPEQVEWAKLIEQDNVFNHAGIVGAWFTKENLPLTAALFKDLGDDLRALDGASKKPFLRPRPSASDARLQPCVTVPASTSYPSGSAMQAFVWAELLADLFPDRRDALLTRAHRAAWGRVLGGVHFPSDLVAGRLLAEAVMAELKKSAGFRAAVEKCRSEVTPFLVKKAA